LIEETITAVGRNVWPPFHLIVAFLLVRLEICNLRFGLVVLDYLSTHPTDSPPAWTGQSRTRFMIGDAGAEHAEG